jgi:hypothetical protein
VASESNERSTPFSRICFQLPHERPRRVGEAKIPSSRGVACAQLLSRPRTPATLPSPARTADAEIPSLRRLPCRWMNDDVRHARTGEAARSEGTHPPLPPFHHKITPLYRDPSCRGATRPRKSSLIHGWQPRVEKERMKREMERGSHACRYLIADSTQLNFTSAERESQRGCCGGTVSLALVAPMWRPLSKARSRQRAVRRGALLYRIINYRWSKEIAIERQQIHL